MSKKVSKSKKKIYGRNRRIAIVVVLASLLVVAVGAVAGVLIWAAGPFLVRRLRGAGDHYRRAQGDAARLLPGRQHRLPEHRPV